MSYNSKVNKTLFLMERYKPEHHSKYREYGGHVQHWHLDLHMSVDKIAQTLKPPPSS